MLDCQEDQHIRQVCSYFFSINRRSFSVLIPNNVAPKYCTSRISPIRQDERLQKMSKRIITNIVFFHLERDRLGGARILACQARNFLGDPDQQLIVFYFNRNLRFDKSLFVNICRSTTLKSTMLIWTSSLYCKTEKC